MPSREERREGKGGDGRLKEDLETRPELEELISLLFFFAFPKGREVCNERGRKVLGFGESRFPSSRADSLFEPSRFSRSHSARRPRSGIMPYRRDEKKSKRDPIAVQQKATPN